MRFRLATTGQGGGDGTSGFGRGFQALAMMPMMRAQAAEEGQKAQADMDMRAAQQRQADAHAALFGQQAEAERAQLQRGSFPELIATAARINRVAPEQMPEAQQYFQSGQLAGKYELPGALPGPTLPKPEYANPQGVGGDIMRTLGLLQGGLAAGDKNIDNVAQAQGRFQHQDAVRNVMADPSSAGRVGQAFAASEGKKLIDNIGDSGTGYNQFTGQEQALSPAMQVLFGRKGDAEIGQKNAAATNSLASAGQHRAQTDKIRQEFEQGARTGDLQVVTGTDGAITIVNKRERTAQPVLGADGKPVVKGTAGGGGKPMTEGQAKANIYGGRMLESDKILAGLEEHGVVRPGTIKSFAEEVAGAVPIVGDSLRQGAGSATNFTQSPQQQQVEQARRDFVNAVLRRESGAAISPSEFQNAEKQYFPQMGDSKQVLAQKRRNRQIATTLMLQEVPEAQRYRLGMVPPTTAPTAAPAGPGGATGSWDSQSGGRNVKVDF